MNMPLPAANYWSRSVDEMMRALDTSAQGLASLTAAKRLKQYSPNRLAFDHGSTEALRLFLERFRSPLVLILIFAALVALIVHDWLNASIVLGIVFITAVLGFIQEYRATRAVERLRRRVAVKTTVIRDGKSLSILAGEVVPGDILPLTAGCLIPGDGVLLEAKDFHVNQALLTGETFPVEKRPGISPEGASLAERTNCVFMGTSVRSGTATALIVHTGQKTHYGQIANTLACTCSQGL